MSDAAEAVDYKKAYTDLRREMLAVEQFALLRSQDGMIKPHERSQWRRLLTIARRAVGEK